jgi:DNA-binding MarR family transcriptional regulator
MIHQRILRIQAEYLSERGKRHRYKDLTLAQLHTILTVRMQGQLSLKRLSKLLGVAPPTASNTVDKLVEKGILTREQSRTDRRKVVVSVSPAATADIAEMEQTTLRSFVDLVIKIGPDTARSWCDILSRVRAVLENNR